MTRTTILRNEFVEVVRTEDGISWYDLTDKYNGYCGFTQAKRGLEKATSYISGLASGVKSRVKMGEITKLLAQFNLKPHTYCSVD
jgi:hypothetical protein